jgi:uncharacterized membrane protein YkoI
VLIAAFGCLCLLWTARSLASYPLPSNKAMLKPCREAALKRHPGVVERLRGEVHQGVYYYTLLIRASDDGRWLLACDSRTGAIVKEAGLGER